MTEQSYLRVNSGWTSWLQTVLAVSLGAGIVIVSLFVMPRLVNVYKQWNDWQVDSEMTTIKQLPGPKDKLPDPAEDK